MKLYEYGKLVRKARIDAGIEGLTPAQQFLVAGFARTELTAKQIDELSDMLSKIQKGGL